MTSLSIFNTQIRTQDNFYSLNDLHKASSGNAKHKPSNFLRIEQTRELITEIERCSDMSIAIKTKRGGTNQGTYVCKELVYAYAMWISAKFHLQVIRAFDALATKQIAPTTITPAQKRSLINKVNQIAKNSDRTHQSIWGQLNSKFEVATYKELPSARFDDAMNYLNGVDSIARARAIAYQLDLPEAISIDTAHDVTGQLCVYLRKSNLENSTQITQAIEALYKWGVSQWSLIDHIANSAVMKRKGYTRISG